MPLEYVHNKLVIYTGEEIVGCSGGLAVCLCLWGGKKMDRGGRGGVVHGIKSTGEVCRKPKRRAGST